VSALRFADPVWVHALWVVLAFVAGLLWLERRGGSALDRFVSATMQSRLAFRPAAWRRSLRVALIGLAAAALVLALMRPQWGLRYVATPRVGAEIMVCLDVSKSMLADDVAPSRLERAKAEIADLLPFLDGDRVGLIAFAGRASVLSPLTPDFAFLRLVLDSVDTESVTRGGTRIGEAIRKAVKGFGAPGESSRAILLVSDGEDHDSFPLDAAREAARVGIRIIAIGFGDEAGSEIRIRDPRSGVRRPLLDAEGNPVRSRLDGELLRELALAAEGAYVPAGTGVLDLESIYREHIAGLTRGRLAARGRSVREEGYQWAVLLALVLLVGGVAIASGPGRAGGRAWLGLGAALLLVSIPGPLAAPRAETPDPQATQPADVPEPAPPPASEADEPQDPREMFNRGLAALEADDPDEAGRWFRRARREAGGDGELRVAAAYNLGWSAAAWAAAREAEEPDAALALLYEAADWFRLVTRQRPVDSEARHNLEVILRQALLLADRIAQERRPELEERLEDLAASERAFVADVAELSQALARADEANVEDRYRNEFGSLAAAQRGILSDADRLATDVGETHDLYQSRLRPEHTAEQAMGVVQLAAVLDFMHRARERMGQARRQLRQRQAERAVRRASAALAELKRALDQLRDPLQILNTLIVDATGLGASTARLARAATAEGEDEPAAPPWLTTEWLHEEQQTLVERTAELASRLRAAVEQGALGTGEPEMQEILRAVQEAEPWVARGQDALARAAEALQGEDPGRALPHQAAGIAALAEARESFLDLRGLIEAIHTEERHIAAALGHGSERAAAPARELHAPLQAAQHKNLERAERLARLLDADDPFALEGEGPVDEETRGRREQAAAAAREALAEARAAMEEVAAGLAPTDGAPDWAGVRAGVRVALARIEALRRIFFSIAEELADIAARQLDLADRTQDAQALQSEAAGPLAPAQRDLARRSVAVAAALEEQASAEGPAVEKQPDWEEASRRLREAAGHVRTAQSAMTGAAARLEGAPPDASGAHEDQRRALDALRSALARLVPPQQRKAGEGSSAGDNGAEDETREGASSMAPAQQLQAVRDREARRRRDRREREGGEREPVERDW
jgi:Ca-activated chloride channel family protein